jgi:hypothetical protein
MNCIPVSLILIGKDRKPLQALQNGLLMHHFKFCKTGGFINAKI